MPVEGVDFLGAGVAEQKWRIVGSHAEPDAPITRLPEIFQIGDSLQYNMGSSGVLGYCGRQWFKLIVSRRFDGKSPWGWTLMRRRPADGMPVAEYLVMPDGSIPSFDADVIYPYLRGDRKRYDGVHVSTGTVIKLYDYQVGSKFLSFRGSREALNENLVETILPFRLLDFRQKPDPKRGGERAEGIDPRPFPLITKLMALYPLPANAVTTGDIATYGTAGLQTIVEDYFTIRADHKLSDKDSLNGTYFFDKAPQNLPDALTNVVHQVFTKRQMVGITESHIFSPALANVARLGFNRVVGLVNEPVKAIHPAAADTSLGVSPGLFAPLFNVAGLTPAGGLGNPSLFFHHYNSYQFYDDVFLTRGKHSCKAGFAYERLHTM